MLINKKLQHLDFKRLNEFQTGYICSSETCFWIGAWVLFTACIAAAAHPAAHTCSVAHPLSPLPFRSVPSHPIPSQHSGTFPLVGARRRRAGAVLPTAPWLTWAGWQRCSCQTPLHKQLWAARLVCQGLESSARKISPRLLVKGPAGCCSTRLSTSWERARGFPTWLLRVAGTSCLQHLPSPRRGEDLPLTCVNEEERCETTASWRLWARTMPAAGRTISGAWSAQRVSGVPWGRPSQALLISWLPPSWRYKSCWAAEIRPRLHRWSLTAPRRWGWCPDAPRIPIWSP